MSSATAKPKRGEVWRVALEPIRGSEQDKTRPVVVMSGGNIGRPSVYLCVPITGFQNAHAALDWYVLLPPVAANGLTKPSSADASQVRALDMERFEAKLGKLAQDETESIAEAVALCVGYKPAREYSPDETMKITFDARPELVQRWKEMAETEGCAWEEIAARCVQLGFEMMEASASTRAVQSEAKP